CSLFPASRISPALNIHLARSAKEVLRKLWKAVAAFAIRPSTSVSVRAWNCFTTSPVTGLIVAIAMLSNLRRKMSAGYCKLKPYFFTVEICCRRASLLKKQGFQLLQLWERHVGNCAERESILLPGNPVIPLAFSRVGIGNGVLGLPNKYIHHVLAPAIDQSGNGAAFDHVEPSTQQRESIGGE